jgi:drug/metabolite transporter (DMT)-like permease
MDWFYLALIAPAIWAIVNLIDDNLIRGVYRHPAFGTIISGLLALLPLLSLFFIDITIPSTTIIIAAVTAGFLAVCSWYFYFKSLLHDTPSVAISLWTLSPAFVPFLAYFFLGEVLTLNQYGGFALILFASLGIAAINVRKLKFSPALLLMFFASVLTATLSVILKYVYSQVDFWSGFILTSIGMGLGGIFFIIITKEGRNFFSDLYEKRKWLWIFVILEVLNITAVLISNLAISKGPVSLVNVVGGIQPLYVLLFALALSPFFPAHLREATSSGKMKKIAFMAVMILGLYIINL